MTETEAQLLCGIAKQNTKKNGAIRNTVDRTKDGPKFQSLKIIGRKRHVRFLAKREKRQKIYAAPQCSALRFYSLAAFFVTWRAAPLGLAVLGIAGKIALP